MEDVAAIARKLSEAQRTILLRTPLMIPAPAYLIAQDNITSGMVAAFGRSHDVLFQRHQPTANVRVEYRLSPLGQLVRTHLQKGNQ